MNNLSIYIETAATQECQSFFSVLMYVQLIWGGSKKIHVCMMLLTSLKIHLAENTYAYGKYRQMNTQ